MAPLGEVKSEAHSPSLSEAGREPGSSQALSFPSSPWGALCELYGMAVLGVSSSLMLPLFPSSVGLLVHCGENKQAYTTKILLTVTEPLLFSRALSEYFPILLRPNPRTEAGWNRYYIHSQTKKTQFGEN